MSGKMPRVVPDQRSKFENEEFFRKLSRECEVSLCLRTLCYAAEIKLLTAQTHTGGSSSLQASAYFIHSLLMEKSYSWIQSSQGYRHPAPYIGGVVVMTFDKNYHLTIIKLFLFI